MSSFVFLFAFPLLCAAGPCSNAPPSCLSDISYKRVMCEDKGGTGHCRSLRRLAGQFITDESKFRDAQSARDVAAMSDLLSENSQLPQKDPRKNYYIKYDTRLISKYNRPDSPDFDPLPVPSMIEPYPAASAVVPLSINDGVYSSDLFSSSGFADRVSGSITPVLPDSEGDMVVLNGKGDSYSMRGGELSPTTPSSLFGPIAAFVMQVATDPNARKLLSDGAKAIKAHLDTRFKDSEKYAAVRYMLNKAFSTTSSGLVQEPVMWTDNTLRSQYYLRNSTPTVKTSDEEQKISAYAIDKELRRVPVCEDDSGNAVDLQNCRLMQTRSLIDNACDPPLSEIYDRDIGSGISNTLEGAMEIVTGVTDLLGNLNLGKKSVAGSNNITVAKSNDVSSMVDGPKTTYRLSSRLV